MGMGEQVDYEEPLPKAYENGYCNLAIIITGGEAMIIPKFLLVN